MRQLLIFLLPIILFIGNVQAGTFITTISGDWETGGTWTNGIIWPVTNPTNNSDNITISHNVTLTGNISVKGGTVLTVDVGDTLTINGDVTFQNNSNVNINGVLVINGDVTNNNNSDEVVINGLIIINGDFWGGNGSDIVGAGGMNITGTVTTDGTGAVFGSELDCVIPGTCNSSYNSPLPIELINWYGHNKNDINHLSWVTISEINNSHFLIERSVDVISWQIITEISGAGTSTSPIFYEYKDSDYENTINYYRLMQIDFNGESETFNILVIDNSLKSPLKIIKTINLMGQEVNKNYNGLRVLMYEDGSRKIIQPLLIK